MIKYFKENEEQVLQMIEKLQQQGISPENMCFVIDTTNCNNILLTTINDGSSIDLHFKNQFQRKVHRFNGIPIVIYSMPKGAKTINIDKKMYEANCYKEVELNVED